MRPRQRSSSSWLALHDQCTAIEPHQRSSFLQLVFGLCRSSLAPAERALSASKPKPSEQSAAMAPVATRPFRDEERMDSIEWIDCLCTVHEMAEMLMLMVHRKCSYPTEALKCVRLSLFGEFGCCHSHSQTSRELWPGMPHFYCLRG